MEIEKVLSRIYIEPAKLDEYISFYEDLFQAKLSASF
jgi:hypothetical protein